MVALEVGDRVVVTFSGGFPDYYRLKEGDVFEIYKIWISSRGIYKYYNSDQEFCYIAEITPCPKITSPWEDNNG